MGPVEFTPEQSRQLFYGALTWFWVVPVLVPSVVAIIIASTRLLNPRLVYALLPLVYLVVLVVITQPFDVDGREAFIGYFAVVGSSPILTELIFATIGGVYIFGIVTGRFHAGRRAILELPSLRAPLARLLQTVSPTSKPAKVPVAVPTLLPIMVVALSGLVYITVQNAEMSLRYVFLPGLALIPTGIYYAFLQQGMDKKITVILNIFVLIVWLSCLVFAVCFGTTQ